MSGPPPAPRGAAAPAHGEARELLLAAAARLFSERGLDGVSVREIGAEAGVGHAGVNSHFRSKHALYQEVLLRHAPRTTLPERVEAARCLAAGFVRSGRLSCNRQA